MLEKITVAQSSQDNTIAETQALAKVHQIGLVENNTTEVSKMCL